jgi:hypothetical protein
VGVRWGRRPEAEKGAAQRSCHGQPLRESVRERWRAQSPTAQPHQEGVAETWVFAEMGLSKTNGLRRGKKHLPFEKDIRRGRRSFAPPYRLLNNSSQVHLSAARKAMRTGREGK